MAAVTIKDGEASVTNESVKFGGTIDGQTVSDLKVVAYKGYQGGVYADGAATDAVVDNAVIYCEDAGKGVGGPDTAVSARNNASLTIRNSVIDTIGKNRFCTTAEYGAKLRVYDSLIYAHGIPYGEGYAPCQRTDGDSAAGAGDRRKRPRALHHDQFLQLLLQQQDHLRGLGCAVYRRGRRICLSGSQRL